MSHEIAHYYNGDLILKLILSLFTAIYWWNPFIYLLQNQITKILEINVDEIASYKWTLLYKSNSPFTISQRVNIMLDNILNPIKLSVFKTTALLFLSLSLFCFPIFISFEAWDIDPNVATEPFSIDEQNSFYINNNDGTFDLYIDNKYIITVTEVFDKSIKIIEREHTK